MNCHKCERKLQKVTFDHCMYCGAEIPDELKLSTTEKDQRNSTQKNLNEKNKSEIWVP
jgi:rRNA maturation endonuclease Nob1